MDLYDFEKEFNINYDIEKIKMESIEELKILLYDDNVDIETMELRKELDIELNRKNLKIKFAYVSIIINKIESKPFFRVRFIVANKMDIPIFWYDAEYNNSGVIIDDYYGKY